VSSHGACGQDAEPVAHGRGGVGEALAGVGQDLLAVAVAQVGVLQQPVEDLGQVLGAEGPPTDLAVAGGEHLGDLLQPDPVQFLGGEVEAGVDPDEGAVQVGAAGDPLQPGPVVGAGHGEQVVGQHGPVAGEGRAQHGGHRVGHGRPPRRLPVPPVLLLGGRGDGGERVGVER
jgi:hypothetical protein